MLSSGEDVVSTMKIRSNHWCTVTARHLEPYKGNTSCFLKKNKVHQLDVLRVQQ